MPTKSSASRTRSPAARRSAPARTKGRVEALRRSRGSAADAASPGKLDVAAIRKALGLPRRVFARLTGYSERALADWEAGRPPSGSSRQRMVEMDRLGQALSRVMRPDYVATWLQTPNPGFDEFKPLELVERGEVDRLWEMIYLLESGQPG